MLLAESTPILPGETLMSWVARLGRREAGLGPFLFLNFVELNRKEVIEASPVGLDRLVAITGASRPLLEDAAYRQIGKRVYTYRGQEFHAEFAGRERTTFCPACLLDDSRPDGPSLGHRVGRVAWFFAPVRTCGRHRIPLVRHRTACFEEKYQDMALVAPDDTALAGLVRAAPQRDPSALQTYVERRFAGEPGPAWLDGQTIEQAARASEIVGACLLYGAMVNLPDLSEDEWDAAGAAGFAHTSLGIDGVRAAFDRLRDRALAEDTRGGPQAVFGRLYQWIQFKRGRKSRGPIEDALRDYILDHFPIEPGAKLFGVTVVSRRCHSVATLAKQSGVHPNTVNRALVLSDLIPSGDPDRINPGAVIEAHAAEALIDKIQNSVPIKAIPDWLNCHRTQAQALVQHGLLKSIVADDRAAGSILKNVPVAELFRFLDRFRASGQRVAEPSAGMKTVIEASEAARWPTIDIVRVVLEGRLSRIELLPEDRKFKSVLVDPQEVKRILDRDQARDRLSIEAVAQRLRLTNWAVRSLMNETDRDGRPFLAHVTETNSKGAAREYFEVAEIERFETSHVDLAELAKELGVHSRKLPVRLAQRGIEPILPRVRLNRFYYRRSDLTI